jgi:adenylate cyclase
MTECDPRRLLEAVQPTEARRPPPTRQWAWLERLGSLAFHPEDDAHQRARKQLATLVLLGGALSLLMGGSIVWLQGRRLGALLFLLNGATCLSSVLLVRWRLLSMPGLVWLNIVANILFSTGIGLALGGFIASGGNPMWGFIAPLAALFYVSRRAGLLWLGLFSLSLVVTILYPMLTGAPPPDMWTVAPLLVFNTVAAFAFVYFTLSFFLSQREHAYALLEKEQERSERLLHAMLPSEVASRLKEGDASIGSHPSASVLFADLVGFTPLSASCEPRELVALLDEVFGTFDAAVERHGLEKIKTIGDCYMVAAGVPRPREDHAVALSRLALELQRTLAERTFRGRRISFRIGIHSGPVVAGIIGRRRFLYDLWGDTVNTASRMEQHGVAGEVQVSEQTRALLGDAFALEERGVVEVKGKGPMRLFLLMDAPEGAHRLQSA